MNNTFNKWLENANADKDLISELEIMRNDQSKIENAFFRELEFGTGGLRGEIGAGTNRMNIYTVGRATRGLANYLTKKHPNKKCIAIGYDTRNKSNLFAETSAKLLSEGGFKVYLFDRPLPTPMLSFAVRELKCCAGIMITASHNPSIYNGFKVYADDGCQITTEAANDIYQEISSLDYFDCIPKNELHTNITKVPTSIYNDFLNKVSELSICKNIDKNIHIVFTPLNGTGLEPVIDILTQNGFANVTIVTEQAEPDGNFPTSPYPNPEIPEAMSIGIDYAKKHNADILLATDPDCDRVGVAIKADNEYQLLTGNEIGLLLLNYICAQKKENGTMPKNPICVKTIVTSDLAEKLATDYGVSIINVLTGFKYIGEQISNMETRGEAERYILGFEESCGYLSGTHVRDKDGVNAALLISEMCAYYKSKGITLSQCLENLYKKYGYCLDSLLSYTFTGEIGEHKMKKFMFFLRTQLQNLGTFTVLDKIDFSQGINNLPKSDVIKLILDNNNSVVIRPSGTEPKLKFYISASSKTKEQALEIVKKLQECISQLVNEA